MKEHWGMDQDALVDICFKTEELNSIIHYVPDTLFRNNQHTSITLEFKPQTCFNELIPKLFKIAIYQEATEKKISLRSDFWYFFRP